MRGRRLLAVGAALALATVLALDKPDSAPLGAAPSANSDPSGTTTAELVRNRASAARLDGTTAADAMPGLRVLVVDAAGLRVGGVPVAVSWKSDSVWHNRKHRTDEYGVAHVKDLPAQRTSVNVGIEGLFEVPGGKSRSSAIVEWDGVQKRAVCRLVLQSAAIVSGRVEDQQGSAVPGARVVLKADHGDLRQAAAVAKTDDAGRFQFQGVPDERLIVRAYGDGRLHGISVVEDASRDITVALGAPNKRPRLDVHVVGPRGESVARYRWRVLSGDDEHLWFLEAGEATTRRQIVLSGAAAPVWLDVWGAASEDGTPLPFGPAFVGPLSLDRPHTVILPMPESLSGRVENSRGDAVPGTTVVAMPLWWPPYGPDDGAALSKSRVGADGTFSLRGLPASRFRLFVVPPEGYARPLPTTVRTSSGRVALRINPSARITVRVTGVDGSPISDVVVRAIDPRLPFEFVRHVGDARTAAAALTDSDGSARLSGLDPNLRYELTVNATVNRRSQYLTHRRQRWRPRATTVHLARAGDLSGRVLDCEGRAVEGCRVSVSIDGSTRDAIRTSADGRYRLRRLPHGTVSLRAWHPDESDAEAVIEAVVPAQDVEIRLP